jgi:hypothetical protein
VQAVLRAGELELRLRRLGWAAFHRRRRRQTKSPRARNKPIASGLPEDCPSEHEHPVDLPAPGLIDPPVEATLPGLPALPPLPLLVASPPAAEMTYLSSRKGDERRAAATGK